DDDPAPRTLTRRGDRGADLGGEVRVVVDEGDAVAFAAILEAARHASECRERTYGGLDVDAELQRDRDRAGRVRRRLHARRKRDRAASPVVDDQREPATSRIDDFVDDAIVGA